MIINIKKIPKKNWLSNKNSIENFEIHRKTIYQKKLLRKIYEFYFKELIAPFGSIDGKKIIELGSGGWNMSLYNENIISSDLIKNRFVDMAVNAQDMQFKNGELDGLIMLDVLHHLPEPERFFMESERVLKDGGLVVMIEPYVSPLSSVIYRFFHHEPYCPRCISWNLPKEAEGRLSGANLATPYNIFFRDRKKFEEKFKNLKIKRIIKHTCISYILSGGLSFRSLVPGFLVPTIMFLEKILKPLYPLLASQMTIVLEKK